MSRKKNKKIIIGTPNDYTFTKDQEDKLYYKTIALENLYSLVLIDPVKYKKEWLDKAGEDIG